MYIKIFQKPLSQLVALTEQIKFLDGQEQFLSDKSTFGR